MRKRLRPLALQATAAERAEKLAGEIEALKTRLAAAELERIESRLAEVDERMTSATRTGVATTSELEGVLEERRKAEEGWRRPAGKHEQATAALYRLRSAVERLELRRERADETAASLTADAERPRLRAAPKPPSYERALAAARRLGAGAGRARGGGRAPRAGEARAPRRPRRPLGRGDAGSRPTPPSQPGAGADVARGSAADARRDRGAHRRGSRRRGRVGAGRLEPALAARVDAGGSRAGELGEELRRLGGWESELRRAPSEAAERVSAIGIERARLETEREEVLRRLPENAEGEPLWRRTRRTCSAPSSSGSSAVARRSGQVNPLAAEEHAREKARLEELTEQREDLERSLAELEALRDELSETVERRFEETLGEVERHFEEVGGTLFPGGSGRIIRVEGDEDEEPGIEIELQPAGKRVTRLSLLSGGEKALGAISFLFALFLARPCPFYLLDEVEAALDDANIGRFTELLRRFADRAQFIVVTHQKRTIEAADILYGVTMGADGISQVVSKRLAGEPEAQALSA